MPFVLFVVEERVPTDGRGDGMNGIQIRNAHPVNLVHPVLPASRDEGRAVFLDHE